MFSAHTMTAAYDAFVTLVVLWLVSRLEASWTRGD
jgi:hypothetical protein